MIYKINFTFEGIKLIGEALDLLPHGKVAPLIRNVQTQIVEQERVLKDQATKEAAAKAQAASRSRKRKMRSKENGIHADTNRG